MEANLPKMGPAFGPHQHGAGRAGGVEQEICEIRASLRIHDAPAPDPANQWGVVALGLARRFLQRHGVESSSSVPLGASNPGSYYDMPE